MDGTTHPTHPLRGMSIRSRVTALVVLATLATGLAAGIAGAWATRVAVNQRYTEAAVQNASRLVTDLHLPYSPQLARTLASIVGGEAVFVGKDRELLASSLDAASRGTFGTYLQTLPHCGVVRLRGAPFRACHAPLAGLAGPGDLWLLIPEATLRQARWDVLLPLLVVCALATLGSALLGVRVSRAVVRPLASLGGELHRFAESLENGEWGTEEPASPRLQERQPAEVALLAQSFRRLFGDLREARQRLAESSRLAAVGKLSASVAHELRNPLAGIRMNAQALAADLAREGREDQSLDLIIRETDRLSLRLEELLGLVAGSRVGQVAAPPAERIALASVRDAVVGLVQTQFQRAGVALRCDGDFAVAVRANADDLRRILLNVLLNALEASASGDTVELRIQDLPDGRVRLVVADQGGGIAPEAGDVFAPFATTKPEGVGLGLAISRELAERNGGELACHSGLDGAEFALSLPRPPSAATEQGIAP